MKKLIVALTIPLMVLAGCGVDDGPGYSHDQGQSNTIPDSTYYVKKIEVDGTKCIIYRDGNMGGISCKWIQPTPSPSDNSDDDSLLDDSP